MNGVTSIPIPPADFHSHILPSIDDGSKNVQMTLEMLNMMADQGIRLAVATPHFYTMRENFARFLERRDNAMESLLTIYDPKRHPRMVLGAEVAYFHGICNTDRLEQLCMTGTRLLLLEMPFCRWTPEILEEVAAIERETGVKPVLAHVERYDSFKRRSVVEFLRESGVMFQSNASFFIEHRTQKRALRMLERGIIDFLGSDAHNLTDRRPNLGDAVEIISAHGEGMNRIHEIEKKYLSAACD